MADDYSIVELDSSEEVKFEVTGRLALIAGDGSHHPDLAKALFKTGAIRRDRSIDIRLTDGELVAVFRTNNAKIDIIYPAIARAQGLVSSAIDHALELKPFIEALNSVRGPK